jgi:hypothetical protein
LIPIAKGFRDHPVALPRKMLTRGYTKIYLEENQLSLGSIGILPLTTSPRMLFHQQRVRTSSLLSEGFILPMVSSPSFGSYVYDKIALLGLGFPMSSPDLIRIKQTVNVNSLTHSSIGTTLLARSARISNF